MKKKWEFSTIMCLIRKSGSLASLLEALAVPGNLQIYIWTVCLFPYDKQFLIINIHFWQSQLMKCHQIRMHLLDNDKQQTDAWRRKKRQRWKENIVTCARVKSLQQGVPFSGYENWDSPFTSQILLPPSKKIAWNSYAGGLSVCLCMHDVCVCMNGLEYVEM